LLDSHSGKAQPVKKTQPFDTVRVISSSATRVANHAGHQSLTLIPTDRMDRAPGRAREIANVDDTRHHQPGGSSAALMRAVSIYSVSSRIVPSAIGIT